MGVPLPVWQLLTPKLPFASALGGVATVLGVMEMTSLLVLTPVMYAAMEGALSVTCASLE